MKSKTDHWAISGSFAFQKYDFKSIVFDQTDGTSTENHFQK